MDDKGGNDAFVRDRSFRNFREVQNTTTRKILEILKNNPQATTVLIAESRPDEMETIKRMVVNILNMNIME